MEKKNALRCEHCGFDLASLVLRIPVTVSMAEHESLICPACSGGLRIKEVLEDAGVIQRDGRFSRWAQGGDVSRVVVGRCTLLLEDVVPLDKRSICFPAIPRIVTREQAEPLGLIPIRPEYMDLLEEVLEKPVVQGGRCKLVVRLRGLGKTPMEHPVVDAPGGSVDGLRLSLWPRVPHEEWKFFLLGAWLSDADDVLRNTELCVTPVYTHSTPDSTPRGFALSADEHRCMRQCLGRPDYVALSLEGGGRQKAGGCIAVEQADRSLSTETGQIAIGIDFGTSNTYLAYGVNLNLAAGGVDNAKRIPWQDLDMVLVDGAPRFSGREAPDSWPPVSGFHPAESAFPSSLLTVQPAARCNPDAGQWLLGEDYGLVSISDQTQQLGYDEGRHLVTNLKWDPRTSGGQLPNQEARHRYLEYLLLCAMANLMAEPDVHGRLVEVKWSYPGVFEREDRLEKHEEAFQQVCETLSEWTGCDVSAGARGLDEAAAASVGTQAPRATDVLYVDVGGGTVDVLFSRYEPPRKECTVPIYALSSFRFAGDDYVNMLVKGKLLTQGLKPEGFLRRVRSTARLDQRFAKFVFPVNRLTAASSRSRNFFMYLVEFMARLIAARMLDGSEVVPDGEKYQVSVNLLGNGWNFVGLLSRTPHKWVELQLKERVETLCAHEAGKAPEHCAFRRGVAVDIQCERNERVLPKQAVAFGLLANEEQNRKPEVVSTGIVGVTTRVARVDYPWYLPVTDGYDPSDARLAGVGMLDDSSVPVWEAELDPGFDPKLPTMFELDEDLKQCYNGLYGEIMPRGGDTWFYRNVLEVVLEQVVRPRVHNLSKGVIR